MKVWALTDGPVSEGKYLVVRRDGTIPAWPHFVIAAADPSAPAALNAYAKNAEIRGLDPEYTDSIRELAIDFGRYAEAHRLKAEEGEHKAADPDQGPHRIDNPAVIEMMRGNGDLTGYRPHHIEAQGSEPAGPNPYYTPTIMAAFKEYKEEDYGGKLGDEPFRLGNGNHADEPYYGAMAEQFRLFKAGALWMEQFCAEHAAERYRALTRPDPSLGGPHRPLPAPSGEAGE